MNRTWIIVGLVVAVLLLLWFVGLLMEIAGALIHLLLVIAVVALIIGFVLGRRSA